MKCTTCKQEIVKPADSIGTGYATGQRNSKYCYACCAEIDKAQMVSSGKIHLYYHNREVTNWPGTLRFPVVSYKTGKHNIAGTRTDVWFRGPDGHRWHGYSIGEWTQVCHCRRTKKLI